ncbi:methyl-CpG-binding domain-containing protein 7 isoform X3 [Vigna angularis]|uniref:methyl-CpG-binding domain-containing protein 7 isoform X3 n=1 Tax=Phaseolus angularis TaxID=3914 RepID=UPI0022B4F0B4|nr:methyl-CpG-binding domain-containing protein 7 isoform X3 [Vigna angularis]
MAWEPSLPMLNPYQDRPQNIVNALRNPQKTRKPILSPELQNGSSSKFNLPEGWIVEERPRRSNPTHVDRNLTESGEAQQSSSMRAVSDFLLEENTSSTAPKSPMKSGAREKRVCGTRYDGESVYRPSSLTKEELSWKYYIPSRKSMKLDYQKKTISESSGTSEHNLTSSPPAKVSWVLSGRTGNWNPKVDGSPVPPSEQVNWSEVFEQSIRRNDGPNN